MVYCIVCGLVVMIIKDLSRLKAGVRRDRVREGPRRSFEGLPSSCFVRCLVATAVLDLVRLGLVAMSHKHKHSQTLYSQALCHTKRQKASQIDSHCVLA